MADRLIQMTEGRGRRTEGLSRRSRAFEKRTARRRANAFFSVFCFLSSFLCCADELTDPTRPPASIAAPVAAASGVAESQPAGLQSIIISKTRRAAIIDGETVELGGKHGDAKLVEVNEGSVVLRSARGRQVMTLFPDVKMTGKQEPKVKSAVRAQSGKRKDKPAAREERK